MTAEAHREFIVQAVNEHLNGDSENLNLLVKGIMESEQAKHVLRSHGFGVTGMGILKTVDEAVQTVCKEEVS